MFCSFCFLFLPFTPTKVLTKENGLVVTAEADPNSKAGSTKTTMSQQCLEHVSRMQECRNNVSSLKHVLSDKKIHYAGLSRKVYVPQPLSTCRSNLHFRPPLIFIRDQIPHLLWTMYWMGYADICRYAYEYTHCTDNTYMFTHKDVWKYPTPAQHRGGETSGSHRLRRTCSFELDSIWLELPALCLH